MRSILRLWRSPRAAWAAMVVCAALGSGACKGKTDGPRPGADGAPPAVVNQPLLDEEVEPNDRPEQATAILPGKAVQGRIKNPERGRDIDHYLVTNQHPKGILRVEVTGVPGLDLVVSVLQKSQRKLLAVANNGGAGAAEIIPNVGVVPGEYLIVVRESGKKPSHVDAPYTLMASLTPAGPGDEVEPNDTRPDAQDVAVGTPLSGYFGKRGDVDWYRLRLPDNVPESNLRVELTGLQSVPFASFSVQDEIEVVLKKGQTGRGTGVLYPNLYVKAGQRLLYLVAGGGKRFSPADKYTITTALTPRGPDEEREPNDRVVQATPLAKGQKMKGYLAPAGDEDWYALEAQGPSIARIAVTGVDNVDLTLSLHDASGTQQLLVDDGKARDGEILPNAYLPGGRALIRVAGKARQENIFQTYELTADLKPAGAGEEREPNNTLAQANGIEVGGTVSGYLYPTRDVDLFKLTVPAIGPMAKVIRFEVKGIPKVPLTLVVKDVQGALFAKAGPTAPEELLRLEKPMPAGVYTLELSGGGQANPRDAYELRVTAP